MAKKVLYADKRIVADDTPLNNEYTQGDIIITSTGVVKIKGASTFTTLGDLSLIGAGSTPTILNFTANGTAQSNSICLVDLAAATGNVTITLPASPAIGDTVVVKNVSINTSRVLAVQKGTSSQSIDGEASWAFAQVFGAITVQYIGSGKWIVTSLYHPGLGII